MGAPPEIGRYRRSFVVVIPVEPAVPITGVILPRWQGRQQPYLALQYNRKKGRAEARGQFNREKLTLRYARSSGSENPLLRKKDLRS